MNLHCKCGERLTNKDLQLDSTGTWCKECWTTSQLIINEFYSENNKGVGNA